MVGFRFPLYQNLPERNKTRENIMSSVDLGKQEIFEILTEKYYFDKSYEFKIEEYHLNPFGMVTTSMINLEEVINNYLTVFWAIQTSNTSVVIGLPLA